MAIPILVQHQRSLSEQITVTFDHLGLEARSEQVVTLAAPSWQSLSASALTCSLSMISKMERTCDGHNKDMPFCEKLPTTGVAQSGPKAQKKRSVPCMCQIGLVKGDADCFSTNVGRYLRQCTSVLTELFVQSSGAQWLSILD